MKKKDGWQYLNGIKLFDNGFFTGGNQPSSNGIFYFLQNAANTAFASSADAQTPVLSGDVDIVVNLFSEFDSTNSVPGHPYENGVYEVGYSVEPVNKQRQLPNEVPVGVIPELPVIRADKTPNQWSYNMPDFTTADSDTMLRRVYKQSFTYGGRVFQRFVFLSFFFFFLIFFFF